MEITIDGQQLSGGVLDLAGTMRIHRLGGGDAFVIALGDATRDGRSLLGRATVVEWGRDALLRVDGRRLRLAWRQDGTRRQAVPGEECRLCFGAFASGEDACPCACAAGFHAECFELRVDCPACGATAGGSAP